MKTTTVLVTGTGGGAGQSVLKCLQHTDHHVIAADGECLGAGLYTTGQGVLIPYATSPKFIDFLLDFCEKHQVKALFPGLDAELPILAKHKSKFEAIGTTVMVSSQEVVSICDDKLATAEFLKSHELPYPKTWVANELTNETLPFPLIIKPKTGGARSKGVIIIRDKAALDVALKQLDKSAYVVQEMISGPEYTCGSLTLGGKCRGTIVLRRILRDGDTYKAFVERNEALEAFVEKVANLLQPFGSCNFQLKLRDGVPYLFEFNARCSGTTYCRALAGYNEPKMILDYLLEGAQPTFTIHPMTVLRYWKELAVDNQLIKDCETSGEVHDKAAPL